MKHPVKCPKCQGRLQAVYTIVKNSEINDDGTIGEWIDGGTHDLIYYECIKCEEEFDEKEFDEDGGWILEDGTETDK